MVDLDYDSSIINLMDFTKTDFEIIISIHL